jgi:4-carboxymuconolactone decarboxylase
VRLRIVTLSAGVLVVQAIAAAQDRMPPIPRDRMTEAQKKAADELISGRRGALIGPFHPLLRSPELMSRLQKTGEYVRFENSLGPKLTELVILLTAREWTQQFEFNAHQPLGLKAGLNQDVIAAIAEGRRPPGMADDEEIAYDFCTELHRNQSVSDTTYARALKRFGEQGVIDMTGLTGYYTVLAMIMNVARTPLPEGVKPPLAAFPK